MTNTLTNLIKKVQEDAVKFGLYIDQLETSIVDTATASYYNLQSSFTVYANSRSITVLEDGTATIVSEEGFSIKSYKKIGSAVKALANMEMVY